MNNARRKALTAVLNELADLRSRVEEVRSDEEDAFENLPENLQYGSERGEQMESAIARLDDALAAFDEIESALNDTVEGNL